MNMYDNSWQSIFINFILIGIILLLLFRVIRYSLPLFARENKQRDYISRQLPVIETILWFLFLSWFTFRFAQKLELYALIVAGFLFILIFWFARFFLRELIAGIIFKSGDRYKKGDFITTSEHSGRIYRFGIDSLEVENAKGQIVFIPYSKLVGDAIHMRSEGADKASGHSFRLTVIGEKNLAQLEQEIQLFALTLPWININKTAQISLICQDANQIELNITIYLIDRNFAIEAEKSFQENFRA